MGVVFLFFAPDNQFAFMLHLFDPFRMQHSSKPALSIQPVIIASTDSGITDGPQVQVNEEEREDHHKAQGMQRIHPAHQCLPAMPRETT